VPRRRHRLLPSLRPDTYGDESSVVRIHSGNGPHEEMERRPIACFDQAMADVTIPSTITGHRTTCLMDCGCRTGPGTVYTADPLDDGNAAAATGVKG